MSGLTDVGAIAGATQEVAKDAQPIISQQVTQAYEDAYKSRVDSIQVALAALVARPGDAAVIAAWESLLTRLSNDAGFVRTGGVQSCYSISICDLGIYAEALALCTKQAEQLAAK